MAQLAAAEKMGYFPTPPISLRLILPYLHAPAGKAVRLLDPCAGRGEALGAVKDHLEQAGVTVYAHAVEVAEGRALDAARLLGPDFVLNSPWEGTATSIQAISALWLNPPYDHETIEDAATKKHERQEYTFLERSEGKLQPGGLLIFIVPQHILGIKKVARHIASRYERITVRALPDSEYDVFKQVVLFGVRRKVMTADEAMTNTLLAFGLEKPASLETAPVIEYTLPPALIGSRYIFRRISMSDEEIAREADLNGVMAGAEWASYIDPKTDMAFQPVIPLRVGHIGTLISSGQIGVVNLSGQALIRGHSTKVVVPKDNQGNIVKQDSKEVARLTEQFSTEIYQIFADGSYKVIKDPSELQHLLDAYALEIAEAVATKYVPIYLRPTDAEWAAAARFMPKKRLPGRSKAGLLDSQKHAVIAMARTAKLHGHCELIAEQGSGKGPMGGSIAAMLKAWPLVIICPGHMVMKWKNELEATVPGAEGTIVRTVADVNDFVRKYHPGQKKALIASMETHKLGPGWTPQAMRRTFRVIEYDAETKEPIGETIEIKPACPKCGAMLEAGWDRKASHCEAETTIKVWNADENVYEKQKTVCGEPLFGYGKPRLTPEQRLYALANARDRKRMEDKARAEGRSLTPGVYQTQKWALARYIHSQLPGFFKGLIADEVHKFKGHATDQANAYDLLVKSVKYVINLTGTYFGGKSTDLFFLRYRCDRNMRREFGWSDSDHWAKLYGRLEYTVSNSEETTGVYSGKRRRELSYTEKPGISPAVYRHILPTALFMRVADLGYKLPKYDEAIVRLKMTAKQAEQYRWLYNVLYDHIRSGLSSYDSKQIKEARALLSVWLMNTLYRPMSGYRTETIWWSPPPGAGHVVYKVDAGDSATYGYQPIDDQAREAEAIVDHYQSDNLQDYRGPAQLGLPAHVTTRMTANKTEPMVLYPANMYGTLLPKEQWLLDLVLDQKRRGRKTLIYVAQTGTRDIQRRLVKALTVAGISAMVLPDMQPAKRESWIDQNVDDLDVLITNPKKVETGLDLIKFAACVFYEIQTSLFVVAQAMKRVYRLGQTQDVEVFFPIYTNTAEDGTAVQVMEGRMLALIAAKMQAMMLLYGDTASTALADESDSDDLMAQLAKEILAGQELDHAGIESVMKHFIAPESEVPIEEEIDMTALGNALDDEESDEAASERGGLTITATFADGSTVAVTNLPDTPAEESDAVTKPWWEIMAEQQRARADKRKPTGKGKPLGKKDNGQLDLFASLVASDLAAQAIIAGDSGAFQAALF